jgi:bla regulator protein blaR1
MIASVCNHLWQSTIFAALAALLALVLRRERARVRYWVWLAASLKFLVPFGALIVLGSHLNWRLPVAATPQTVTLIQSVSQPYSQAQLDLAAAAQTVAGPSTISTLPAVLVGAWLFGFVVCLFVWLMRWRRLAAIVAGASPLESGPELESLRRLEKALGITPPVPLLASSNALEPGVFGIMKPVLLWPANIGLHLEVAHVEAIVAHEVCHIRRRDNLAAAVHMFIQACFWFYPLTWWIGARLIDERERACDEGVIELGNAPYVYAQSILKTCQHCVESPLICAAGVTGSDLKNRIVGIMRSEMRRNLTTSRKLLLASAASLAIALPIALGMLVGPRLQAQQSMMTRPSFEVASVKPNKSGDRRVMIQGQPGGRLVATNLSLRQLIRNAYQLQEFQLIGAPDWIDQDRFDIVAKAAAEPPPSSPFGPLGPMQLMLQSLLIDRFKLVAHEETQELPIYALVPARSDAKLGPGLRPSSVDCEALMAAARAGGSAPSFPPPGERPPCGTQMGPGLLTAGSTPMSQLANVLSPFAHRVIVDRTGLKGRFDIDLKWTPDQMPQGPPPPGAPQFPPVDPNGPSLFTAIQEQLGVKLDSQRGPVPVLVIEHVEQPTPD